MFFFWKPVTKRETLALDTGQIWGRILSPISICSPNRSQNVPVSSKVPFWSQFAQNKTEIQFWAPPVRWAGFRAKGKQQCCKASEGCCVPGRGWQGARMGAVGVNDVLAVSCWAEPNLCNQAHLHTCTACQRPCCNPLYPITSYTTCYRVNAPLYRAHAKHTQSALREH